MKRNIILISIILLAIGCTDNSSETSLKELLEIAGYESEEEYIESMMESFRNPYAKEVALLSAKYKIDEDKIKDMLVELNKLHRDSSIIVEYSKKYDIPQLTIASLIIDFYSMQNGKNSM